MSKERESVPLWDFKGSTREEDLAPALEKVRRKVAGQEVPSEGKHSGRRAFNEELLRGGSKPQRPVNREANETRTQIG